MTTVAIVSEYNPFHNGHKYQIEKIRETFGSDTAIIAIMSGNYVQRGDVALLSKAKRAEAAVMEGVNLVLELPFPFSCSSAEIFASAAITIINSLGCVDYVSFGSESGDVRALESIAEIMLSPEFDTEMLLAANDEKLRGCGYPVLCEWVCKKIAKSDSPLLDFSPNNILGIEYIKALKRLSSKTKPHTIKRVGAPYSSSEIVEGLYQSASAIRESIGLDNISALDYLPNFSKDILNEEIEKQKSPSNISLINSSVITNLRLSPTLAFDLLPEGKSGLYNRLKALSFKTNDIGTIVKLATTKKYTSARIRRAILYSLFGVTSSEIKEDPEYTQILAIDKIGRSLLRTIRKCGRISVITKPADTGALSPNAQRQKDASDRADSIYELTLPSPGDPLSSLRFSPFVLM